MDAGLDLEAGCVELPDGSRTEIIHGKLRAHIPLTCMWRTGLRNRRGQSLIFLRAFNPADDLVHTLCSTQAVYPHMGRMFIFQHAKWTHQFSPPELKGIQNQELTSLTWKDVWGMSARYHPHAVWNGQALGADQVLAERHKYMCLSVILQQV